MAILYRAQLTPPKMQLISAWAPSRAWAGEADLGTLDLVGAYRFDDPDGEVGIETILLRSADGQLLQVPVTYRGAPLEGSEQSLIGTTEHSVLGPRWVYDGCGDKVYTRALANAILTGGTQADLDVVTSAGYERREAVTRAWGDGHQGATVPDVDTVTCVDKGTRTIITAGELLVALLRVLDTSVPSDTGMVGTLMGTWPGQEAPVLLASVRGP